MNQESRSYKAIKNTMAGFLGEFVSIVCGLILPRIILSYYGSAVNGILVSVTKFISLFSIANVGISGAARAMLYKPLVENDTKGISKTVAIIKKSANMVALFGALFSFGLVIVYPLYLGREFENLFIISLIIIIAVSTIVKFMLEFPYQILLYADQKHNIVSIFGLIVVVSNTIVSVGIIILSGNVIMMKFVTSIITIVQAFLFARYVKTKYGILDIKIGKEDRLRNRKDAIAHGISDYINSNVDVIVITICSGVKEVSVYVVYNMVISATSAFINNVILSFGAAFGNMNAKKEYDLMKENLRLYELIVFSLTSIIFAVTVVLIVPFVKLYTVGITDINYVRQEFAFVLTMAAVFMCFRIPYETIIKAVGHFKQTKFGAYVEAFVNLILSIVLIEKYGLVGAAIGTMVSAGIRSFEYAFYLGKNVIFRSYKYFLGHVALCLTIILCFYFCISVKVESVLQWGYMAILLTIGSTVVTLVANLIFYKKDTIILYQKLQASIKGVNSDA